MAATKKIYIYQLQLEKKKIKLGISWKVIPFFLILRLNSFAVVFLGVKKKSGEK